MLQFQTLGVVSDNKMNLVGALGRSFFEFPNSFQKRRENPKNNYGITEIFMQNQFSTKSIFLYGCNSKTNHCKYLKFSPNNYVSVIYIKLNFQNFLTFLNYL
ncbi:Uncharacterized protein FWK35_00021471 [Aphis craccivora]|uniref:Uncharacterized protein n=1 Tax=Aphis craccivora TaxID=307492 RepID=A0A6G0YK51_APHCR|nr:Uncharacterized protein FWK35_00021471 [Aphis craccivora]